ncbi:hypothetical protein L195_g027726 [Trifolium pratense]|uniref:PRKR-interacting protein 1-like n=2 Tax=Trifolium pratense TaxID=57577 RepID=A0A2K3KZX0_TRIPR|nr:hypothetical protein L195_g027726 [Trifolium pratense]
MSTGKPKDKEFQMVPAPGTSKPPLPPASNAIVEYTPPVFKEEEEDLEIKLRRIIDNVPVRVSNTSGSSAGSGSGDFHQESGGAMWLNQIGLPDQTIEMLIVGCKMIGNNKSTTLHSHVAVATHDLGISLNFVSVKVFIVALQMTCPVLNCMYRQMRRKEQDRLARMEVDYQKRKELAEFAMRREERLKAAEERTAKKRAKRQKKKQRKKEKKIKTNDGEPQQEKHDSSDDGDSDNDEEAAP